MVIPQNIMTTWICKQLIFSKDIEMFMNIIILRNIYILAVCLLGNEIWINMIENLL